jgi:hypothetical protein
VKSKKESRSLCNSVLRFLHFVYKASSDFRAACRKLETIEEITAILFVNAHDDPLRAMLRTTTSEQPKISRGESSPDIVMVRCYSHTN